MIVLLVFDDRCSTACPAVVADDAEVEVDDGARGSRNRWLALNNRGKFELEH